MAVKREDVKAIVTAIGGKKNLEAATHCVTRLRLVLKDESKVDKDALSNNALVKGQFKHTINIKLSLVQEQSMKCISSLLMKQVLKKLRKMKRKKQLDKRESSTTFDQIVGGYFYTNITCDCDSWFVNGNQ